MKIEAKDYVGSFKKILETFEKYKFLLLVLAIGIVLILLPSSNSKDNDTGAISDTGEIEFSLSAFEKSLGDTLSAIEGVGRVQVSLTLKTGAEKIVARNESISRRMNDESGITRTETNEEYNNVIVSQGSSGQSVVVLKSIYPVFKGALIVCEGGDSAAIRLKVSEAVSALTGIGADKISVLKMKK